MRKFITIFLILNLIGAAHAQKRPAKRQPAGKADTAAVKGKLAEPVKPEGTKPPNATAAASEAKKGSGFESRVLLWGGYNIPSSTAFNNSTSGLTKGGIAGGAEITLGASWLQVGVAASYVSIWSQTVLNANGSMNFNVVPLEGVINILPLGGLYLGARGGYVMDIGTTSITGTTYTKTNGYSIGAQLGYIIQFGFIGIDIGAIFSYMEFTLNALNAPPVISIYKDIMPRIGVNFRF